MIGSGHYASLYNHSYIFNKYVYTSLTSPWVPKNMLTNWSRQTDGNSLRYILWETSYVWGWYIGRTLLRMNVCETSYVMSITTKFVIVYDLKLTYSHQHFTRFPHILTLCALLEAEKHECDWLTEQTADWGTVQRESGSRGLNSNKSKFVDMIKINQIKA